MIVMRFFIIVFVEDEYFLKVGLYNIYCLELVKKFEYWKVIEIIKKIFEEYLMGENYDYEVCYYMSKILVDVIKE